MKHWLKLFAALFFAVLLCACVKGDRTDLVSFCENTKTPQRSALRLTDCLIEIENGERRCFWRLEDGLSLRLICTEDGKIAQCRVILQRVDATGAPLPVTEVRVNAFCALTEQVCAALEEVSPEETETLFETLHLREVKALSGFGSSELMRGEGFTARLVCRNAETVLEISNRWLCPQEEKETPESVPAFDATTNIRTETVPLS